MKDHPDPLDRPIEALIGLLFCGYFGLIAGVSFLATIAKFQAESLSLGQLLEVGHHTFHWLQTAEAWLLPTLALLCIMAGRAYWRIGATVVLAVVWGVQHWVLMPVLDQRTLAVIGGTEVPASSHHIVFAALEGVKLLVLLAAGFACLMQMQGGQFRAGKTAARDGGLSA